LHMLPEQLDWCVMSVKEQGEAREALARELEAVSGELSTATATIKRMQAVLQADAGSPGMTVAEFADRFRVSEAAMVAFAQTVSDLLGDQDLDAGTARRAALIAVSGQAWENELGPLLSSGQVRDLLGGVSRQRVDELLRSQRLIGLRDRDGRRRFPAFQFVDGQPLAPIITAFWTVADGALSEWTAAAWCVAPDEALGGQTPAAWAGRGEDPDRLLQVALQDRARLAQ
jgi:hypothetical protein